MCGWLQLHKRELVVFAVNDNPDVEMVAGGAHWWVAQLLVLLVLYCWGVAISSLH